MKLHAFVVSSLLLGCASSAAIQDRSVSAPARTPKLAQHVLLPPGAKAVAVFAQSGGEGIIALADGRFLSVGTRGDVHPIDRLPGEPAREGESPVSSFSARGPDEAIAIIPGGALAIERGIVHREPLAPFLRTPRAFAALGENDVLWGTAAGLYANYTNRWFALDAPSSWGLPAGALDSVAQIIPFAFQGSPRGARDAWIRTGTRLLRVHLEPGTAGVPAVTWIDPTPGVALGAVQSIARVDLGRGAVTSERGVTLAGEGSIHTFHEEPRAGLPGALAGGGGWAWVAWNGQILRTDGETWESLAEGVAMGPGARIAVDEGTGSFALVLDGAGGVSRIQAEDALFSSGLASGATVFDTKVELEVLPTNLDAVPDGRTPVASTSQLARVTFAIDGKELSTRTSAPWGWGEGGARTSELSFLSFGPHRVDIRAHLVIGGAAKDEPARDLTRTIRFDYASPLGRVPSYEADIAPLYDARCGRCHSGGVASDLSSYERLASQASQVRASIREGRMPPDLQLDAVSSRMFTAWVDGHTPK